MNETHDREASVREGKHLELLVIRCQLGEPDAFDSLVVRWHEPLRRYVRSMTADSEAAEEILQDAWLRILRGIDRLRDPQRFKPWIFSIARRAFLDRLRTRYADAVLESFEDEPPKSDPIEKLEWDDVESLREALDHLTPPDRETIILFYLRELDLQEVATVLGVPVGTVKSRLHRARRLLRTQLESKGVTR